MTAIVHAQPISLELQAFVDKVLLEAEEAFTVFRETNTITANGTVGFIERVPGQELLVSVNYGGPWNYRKPLQATVTDFAGKMISPQSIAVACAATGLVGKESDLFRFTLKQVPGHSAQTVIYAVDQ